MLVGTAARGSPRKTSTMSDEPIRFTDYQRQLFQRVAELIRSDPEAFKEAGQWLDAGADMPEAADVGEGTRNFEIIQAAVEGFGSYPGFMGQPPDYGSLTPELADRQARRVLLVAWILSDPRSLRTNPPISRLQGWDWGVLDFSDDPIVIRKGKKGGDILDRKAPLRINRRYARMTLLDDHLDQWVTLANDALQHLERSLKADDEQPTHNLGAGEWLMPPMSLAEMANRVGNSDTRKIKALLTPHGLQKYPASNRQSWTVRIDLMPQTLRDHLTKRR